MRGWAIELVLIALLVPFFVASVDLFALCRRQRVGLGGAARSLRTRLLLLAVRRDRFHVFFRVSAPGRTARRALRTPNRPRGRLARRSR